MDFEFPPDVLMLRDMLRRFVDKEAKPLEIKYLTTGELDPEDHERLHTAIEQMGLWGATVPEAFGGAGLDLVTSCVLEEELGKTFIPVELGEIPPLLYACQEEQIERFLEPALVGDRRAILAMREPSSFRPESWNTTATPSGDGYILNGAKLLSMEPRPNDFFVLFAREPTGITAFLLEPNLEGITLHRNAEMILRLDGSKVGPGSRLGECGQALALGADEAPRAWIRLSARYVGLASRLVEMAAAYANDWVVFGAPLKTRPIIHRLLAEMWLLVNGTRWTVYHSAWLGDQQKPLRLPAAEARLSAGEMLKKVVDSVTMVYGGPGPTPQIDLQRVINRLLPAEVLEMAIETARITVAEGLLAANTGS